jgi:acyl-CoA reductase-like NAD-dependent aldehyde dehydrogenase
MLRHPSGKFPAANCLRHTTDLDLRGVKESGFGREGSHLGIEEYMVTKMVTLGGNGEALQGA